jgi:hypothetical protein
MFTLRNLHPLGFSWPVYEASVEAIKRFERVWPETKCFVVKKVEHLLNIEA